MKLRYLKALFWAILMTAIMLWYASARKDYRELIKVVNSK